MSGSRQDLYSRRQVLTGGGAALLASSLLPQPAAAVAIPNWKLLGQKTPHFKTPLLRGGVFNSRDYAGRFLFIDFWGLWCPPCVDNAPHVQKLYQRLRSEPKIEFLAIHSGKEQPPKRHAGKWANVAAFAAAQGLTYRIGLDPKMTISRGFRIPAFPSYVLIAPDPDRTALLWRISSSESNWMGLRRDVLTAVVKRDWSGLGALAHGQRPSGGDHRQPPKKGGWRSTRRPGS